MPTIHQAVRLLLHTLTDSRDVDHVHAYAHDLIRRGQQGQATRPFNAADTLAIGLRLRAVLSGAPPASSAATSPLDYLALADALHTTEDAP